MQRSKNRRARVFCVMKMTYRRAKSLNIARRHVWSCKRALHNEKMTLSLEVWEKTVGKSFFATKQMCDETFPMKVLCDKGFVMQAMNIYTRWLVF